jgi:site-specific DNA-methyltransferase (adenine-specific)
MTPKPIATNTLFYGDNLPILREHIADESVDLIYLDPPFNSNRTYNVLFKDESGNAPDAQLEAFDDSWHWNARAEETYSELVEHGPERVGAMIGALHQFIGANQMMAYLVMMAARLVELHRVLKPTGSLYLHCDPAASHYLKIVLDVIFGPENYGNEVIWKRTSAHSAANGWGPVHDVLFLFRKSATYTWNKLHESYSTEYLQRYKDHDEGGSYTTDNLTGPGARSGASGDPWRGYDVRAKGVHWKVNREVLESLVGPERAASMTTQEKLDILDASGYIYWSKKGNATGLPRFKRYLGRGLLIQDVITDIPPINSQAAERLGYPTQKPLALLERIIQASSNPGDVLLDPFCGCGTAVAAAHKLDRRWIGIDITHLAIALQKYRLESMFPGCRFDVVGEPQDIGSAHQLAQENRYQFQWWALSLVRAKPLGGQEGDKKGKKGSDKGIDGLINFMDDNTGKPKQVLVQVKSGHVGSPDIRELKGVLEREKASIGLFVTLEEPTRDMTQEAVTAGHYHSPGWNKDFPKIQILTIAQLLRGAEVKMPPAFGTFKQAQKVQEAGAGQLDLVPEA